MIENVRSTKIWYNVTTEKAISTIESIQCNRDSLEAARVLYDVFKSIVDHPNLLECGSAKVFETANISHNGTRWTIKMEALIPREIT